jgi:signal transduction histidine kinase
LGLFLPSLFINKNFIDEKSHAPYLLQKNWQVYYGQQPVQGDSWQPFDEEEWRKLNTYKGSLWVKRTLPDLPWRKPYLFLFGMNRFEVFLDGQSVYRFNMEPGPHWNHFLMTRHPIPIFPEQQEKEITLHMEWDRMPFVMNSWILAADPDTVLTRTMQRDASRYIYSVLYLTVGIVGLIFFARRKEKLYFWFSMLTLSAGLGLLLLCSSLQWFADVQALYYWKDLLLTLGVYAFTGLYGEVLSASRRLIIRITKLALLLYTVASLFAGIWNPTWYWKMLNDGFPWLAIASIGVVTYALARFPNNAQRQDERRWLLRGYAILVFGGLGHMIANTLFAQAMPNIELWPYFETVIANLLPNGLLLFMSCMVLVVIHRVGYIYQDSERNAKELKAKNIELEQFHRNLEQLVDIRTEELEEANRSLTVTLREKAETLAEVSVLEERNRIAHDMHDVVGHTLTAAIVQLEASKKLAAKEGNLPLEKLDTVSGLVRKGLEDIRKTVRMLKSDSPPVKLEAALRELIRETIETMEVAIEAEIEIPFDLGKLTEKVIYHALQEGLTNGIRHAKCSWFRYTVLPDGQWLDIKLWNDGKPFGFAKPGFGLTSMMERIHLLGGTIEIGSSEGDDGIPVGCELAIKLPLPQQQSSPASSAG